MFDSSLKMTGAIATGHSSKGNDKVDLESKSVIVIPWCAFSVHSVFLIINYPALPKGRKALSHMY